MSALSARAVSVRENPALALLVAVPLAASLVGAALAVDAAIGVALMLGLIYLPVALLNLRLALALWVPLVFLEGLPAFNLAAKAGGLLIVGVWFIAIGRLGEHVAAVLRRNAKLWLALGGLLLWYSLSLLWADDHSMVLADVWHYYAVGLLMLIVATTASDGRMLRLLVVAFVAGAVLAVGEGIVSGGLSTSSTAIDAAASGRLEGGQGDSNFLAAGTVPAMVLAWALYPTARGFTARWSLIGALVVLALGLAASQSRGGAVAAFTAVLAALIFYKSRRAWVLAFIAVLVSVATAWFAVSPGAWERVARFDSGGTGRTELWIVAFRMTEANPIQGVGLNNFAAVSGDYVREPGSLERLDLIVDRAVVVHSIYLQALAETGVVGLGLFLAVALGGMYAAWLAAKRFQASGDHSLEGLARGVVVATIGLLAASAFISSGFDKRLWVLLGLGPALLAVASRRYSSLHPGPARHAPAGKLLDGT